MNRQNAEDQNKNVNTIMFFIIKEAKVTIFDFHQELWKCCECVLQFYFILI